jgi:hypothetical protein
MVKSYTRRMEKKSRLRAVCRANYSSYVQRPNLLALSLEPQALVQDVEVILHTAVSDVSPSTSALHCPCEKRSGHHGVYITLKHSIVFVLSGCSLQACSFTGAQ